jgi:ferredoxin-NADP reductase
MRFETTVLETVKRTPQAKSIIFERPRGFDFLPGQHVSISLKVRGRLVTKTLSISSSPQDTGKLELTKRLTGHEFANALAELKAGDAVEVEGPEGDFTFEGEHAGVLFLTGGHHP